MVISSGGVVWSSWGGVEVLGGDPRTVGGWCGGVELAGCWDPAGERLTRSLLAPGDAGVVGGEAGLPRRASRALLAICSDVWANREKFLALSGCPGVGVPGFPWESGESGSWSLSRDGRDRGELDGRLLEVVLVGDPDGEDWVPCSVVCVVAGMAD